MTRRSASARSIISGIGQSDVGRRLVRDPLDLTLDACLAAIADAGLTRDDIDGIATYPGADGHAARVLRRRRRRGAGRAAPELNWYAGGIESPGQLGSVDQRGAWRSRAGLATPRARASARVTEAHRAGRRGPGRR